MSEIADIIKQIASKKDRVNTFPAIVTNNTIEVVDGNPEYEVTVRKIITDADYDLIKKELDSGKADEDLAKLEMKYVRLKAAINTNDEGLIIVPRKGSWVLVSIIDSVSTKAFVSQYSEIDNILMRVNTPVKEGEDEPEDPEYIEIKLKASLLELYVGKKFKANIDKDNMVFNYLAPSENEDEEPKVLSEIKATKDTVAVLVQDEEAKILSDIKVTKEAVDILVEDKDTEMSKSVHIDPLDLTITHTDSSAVATKIDEANFEIAVDDAKVVLTTDGLEVSNGGKNLKETLAKVIDEIMKIVVVQGTGPAVGALQGLKTDIEKILN